MAMGAFWLVQHAGQFISLSVGHAGDIKAQTLRALWQKRARQLCFLPALRGEDK